MRSQPDLSSLLRAASSLSRRDRREAFATPVLGKREALLEANGIGSCAVAVDETA
jgi:hypothetical protein